MAIPPAFARNLRFYLCHSAQCPQPLPASTGGPDSATQYGDSINYMVYYVLATYLNHWHVPAENLLESSPIALLMSREMSFAGAIQVEMVFDPLCVRDRWKHSAGRPSGAKPPTPAMEYLTFGYPVMVDQYIDNLREERLAPRLTGEGCNEDIVSARMLKTSRASPFLLLNEDPLSTSTAP